VCATSEVGGLGGEAWIDKGFGVPVVDLNHRFTRESPVGFKQLRKRSPGGDSRDGASYSLVCSPSLSCRVL
jgi:hypothetical protein